MNTAELKETAPAPDVPDYILAIAPYQAGKPIDELAREFGLEPAGIVKLASNENPLGMPESARQAMAAAAASLGRYPDPNGFELKSALAARYGVPASWITLGNGSNDLLEIASLALLAPGRASVYSQYAFAVYRLATQARGARHIVVPARDHGHDLEAMFQAIDDDTRLVFIANPNNPTGTFLPAGEIADFLARVRDRHGDRVTVLLDEAYNEYLDPELRFDSARWVEQYSNLIVSRTFSKAYGLAGLRVGFAIAQPRLTDLMNRVRQPFNVNSLAQAAAIAALGDTAFLQRSYEINKAGKAALVEAFTRLGLRFVPSYGNFVLVHVGDAARINLELLKRGVIVRPVAGDGLPEWLRVSIGLPEENQRFVQALTDILSP
ncbi:histidinol-phosphate transaminase [Parapusillimonas granuli]|uniref:Histidinol-phosphate aminotransferase n=1 Tax=Parapusillimonas granuli TaxID=380911 RepID=A0A853FZ05_9BURK|nr:histidinol-phosphate transaminase [Parapusillimonas granuli]MBB5217109.1 histidinol-phosphate aminotransferase [Parapusillimonas granuli]MEB2401574.1 histidinol-phosphate transaminase [Alcaligenaceae bacterium]NYT50128.1 histidinol-phosphate transaminase [Parapusillimonas granuli]